MEKRPSYRDVKPDSFHTSFEGHKKINFVRTRETLQDYDFELLISEISLKLNNSDLTELDSVIEGSLQNILDFLQIDKAALLQEEHAGSVNFAPIYVRTRTGFGFHDKSFLRMDSFVRPIEIRESRFTDLPKVTYRVLGPDYSEVAIPLYDENHVHSVFVLGLVKESIWPDELEPGLLVLAHLFSAALIRKKMEQKLDETLQQLKATRFQLEHRGNISLHPEVKIHFSRAKMIFKSQIMNSVLTKAEQVAATNATVLLCGETGTGKEMIASAIHEMSSRSDRTMVRINCSAIPAALVESEIFGREKGAYTGALSRQIGRFELADLSSIFLDEITELPMEVQVKLLRVLQEKEIERLGNPIPIHIDVRIIAATNQNIEKALREGKFREDLYYRLNVFPIEIPPLRERREDIPMLVWSFVDELCGEFGKKVESISAKNMEALMDYSWPGNVRELRNIIERSMIVSNSPKLNIEIPKATSSNVAFMPLTLKEMEIQHIRRVLENAAWKIRGKQGAAEILGMKPTTLETRMAKLGINRPDNKNGVCYSD